MINKILYVLLSLVVIISCDNSKNDSNQPSSGKLKILASTSIVADVISNVAGPDGQVQMLLEPGTNPHSFEPTPRDISKISKADIIFINGFGLEQFLDKMIKTANSRALVVNLSGKIVPIHKAPAPEGDPAEHNDHDHDHNHGTTAEDPHVWTDPANVILWVDTAVKELSEADPQNGETYAANGAKYIKSLEKLDHWILDKVKQVPEAHRKLVTDHAVLGYFSKRYGFRQVGTIIPGYSAMSAPSAREIAQLQDTIRSLQVKAVFVGNTVNPLMGRQIAADTGTELVQIYTGSLSIPGSSADTYINYCRHNVNAIVAALSK